MRRARGLVVTLCAVIAVGCGGGHAQPRTEPASNSTLPASAPGSYVETAAYSPSVPCGWRTRSTYHHVVWIWLENRSYSSVMGSGSAMPNLHTYASRCGLATSYYAVTHPSLPNYLAATSGSTGGVSSDCAPASCPQRRSSLFAQIQGSGRQWRSYEESMPHACDLSSSGSYAPKHNPAAYFTPVRSRCTSWDVPMGGSTGAFASALSHRTLPAFAFVTPNLCDDGHDCPNATVDRWLGTWLGRIVGSAAYRAGDTAVFLTYDEGVGSSQRVATVVIAPTVPRGLRVATTFTHYSLLRTTEEIFALGRLGKAATARSMRSAFHL